MVEPEIASGQGRPSAATVKRADLLLLGFQSLFIGVRRLVVGTTQLRRISRFVAGSVATLGVALAGPAPAAAPPVAAVLPPAAEYRPARRRNTPTPSAGAWGWWPHAIPPH